MLCGSNDGQSEFLQASCTPSFGDSGLSMPPTRFAVIKTDSPKFLQALYTLCGSQNGLSKHLQPSYTLCDGQD